MDLARTLLDLRRNIHTLAGTRRDSLNLYRYCLVSEKEGHIWSKFSTVSPCAMHTECPGSQERHKFPLCSRGPNAETKPLPYTFQKAVWPGWWSSPPPREKINMDENLSSPRNLSWGTGGRRGSQTVLLSWLVKTDAQLLSTCLYLLHCIESHVEGWEVHNVDTGSWYSRTKIVKSVMQRRSYMYYLNDGFP